MDDGESSLFIVRGGAGGKELTERGVMKLAE